MNRIRISFLVFVWVTVLGCAGCASVDVAAAARSSLSSFVTGVVTEAINSAIVEP